MSVSTMKKLTVFAHREETDELIRRLVRLRCVDVRTAEISAEQGIGRYDRETAGVGSEDRAAEVEAAMTVLSRYATRTRSLVRPKAKVDMDNFLSDGSADRAWQVVKRTLATSERQSALRSEIAKIESLREAALPYRAFDAPLGMTETERTDVLLGAVPAGVDMVALGKELYGAGAVAELLSENAAGRYISVFCCKSDTEAVSGVLSSYGFVRATFRGVEQGAGTYLRRLETSLSSMREEQERLEQSYVALAEELESVEILYDAVQTELTENACKQQMASTEATVLLSGWVPERAQKRVEELLAKHVCAYELTDPTEEDNPPILLQNNGFAANFEWVLGMYSYPKYGRFDPTFIMSIFYFIIFGIMFADAGYGLVLILACFGGVTLLKPGQSMERFLTMFGYCGISCVVFGVLFGAYFGDLPLAIMRNMMGIPEAELPNLALLGSSAANVAVLFDPLQNPMGFLVVSLGIGAIHLIAGMAVKFYILCRDGHPLDAILDIGAYWLLFAGIVMIFLLPTAGVWVAVAAVVLIVLTHGRSEKNPVMKLLKGLLGIYDLISYVSDLLSYSRILALGLAAGVIAQVVNILGTMGGASVGGFIGLVIAFVVGHLLNIAINVLGTFVHTSRLQYIEFFGKFYEDGGIPFEPAVPSEKYTEE